VSGCRNQSAYLMGALAQAGMIVAAPNHTDERCNQPLTRNSLPKDIANPLEFKDATYAARRDQLRTLRDSLVADPELGKRIDPNKLILVGHSLGGYTVLALAGAQAGAVPPGLKAVVALAPYLLPFGGSLTLPDVGSVTLPNAGAPDMIKVPVLIEAGAKDSASSTLPSFGPRLGGKLCTEIFPDAGHFAWVDSPDLPDDQRQSEYQIATATAAITFIQQVLETGVPTTPAQSTPPAVVHCWRGARIGVLVGDGHWVA